MLATFGMLETIFHFLWRWRTAFRRVYIAHTFKQASVLDLHLTCPQQAVMYCAACWLTNTKFIAYVANTAEQEQH